jgi:hypothetical protein
VLQFHRRLRAKKSFFLIKNFSLIPPCSEIFGSILIKKLYLCRDDRKSEKVSHKKVCIFECDSEIIAARSSAFCAELNTQKTSQMTKVVDGTVKAKRGSSARRFRSP